MCITLFLSAKAMDIILGSTMRLVSIIPKYAKYHKFYLIGFIIIAGPIFWIYLVSIFTYWYIYNKVYDLYDYVQEKLTPIEDINDWRFLEEDEIIQKGDCFYNVKMDKFIPVNSLYHGQRNGEHCACRKEKEKDDMNGLQQ